MKKILFMNKYLLALIPFLIPVIMLFYNFIVNVLINTFPIKPILLPTDNININYWWKEYKLTPIKHFWVNWKLISKKNYSNILNNEEKVIATDWLFGFWDVTWSKYLNNLEISQVDRSFSFDYKSNINLTRKYILTHLINLNLLSNSNKINKKLSDLKIWSNLKIFWYLVNIELLNSNSYFKQNTSTVLTDIWYWSSEILFVTRLEINWKVID